MKNYQRGQQLYCVFVAHPRWVEQVTYLTANLFGNHSIERAPGDVWLTDGCWLFRCREDAHNRLRALKEFNQ